MTTNRVIEILMKRDGVDYNTAKSMVEEASELIMNNPDEVDEIMSDELGLEPDYIFDIL